MFCGKFERWQFSDINTWSETDCLFYDEGEFFEGWELDTDTWSDIDSLFYCSFYCSK